MSQQPTPYDGLLVLGSGLRGLSSNNWNPLLVPKNGPFIQVDASQQVIARSFPVTLGIVGEAGDFLRGMLELLPEFPPVTADVQARQARMGVRRTEEGRVKQARQGDVIDVTTLAAEEARVLAPPHGSAEVFRSHQRRAISACRERATASPATVRRRR